MNILVVGCGSIGQRHIRNLKTLHVGEVSGCDIDSARCHKVVSQLGVRVFRDFAEALMKVLPDAVLVCTPTSLHIPDALSVARSGCHLFIEKPLSHSLEGVDELVDIVAQKNLVTLIGCNMRFHPSIAKIKNLLESGIIGKVVCVRIQAGQYLPDWHPWEDYRHGYSANRSMGGGIILDSIHEIDYITWFLGEVSHVSCFAGKLSSLEIDTEDTAEILLQFKSGTIGEVHLDYVQRIHSRSCQIIGEEGTILWDFNDKQVKVYSAKIKEWQISPEEPNYDTNEMYIEEIKHFLQCLMGKAKSAQDIYNGKRVLEIALAAKESAKSGCVVEI